MPRQAYIRNLLMGGLLTSVPTMAFADVTGASAGALDGLWLWLWLLPPLLVVIGFVVAIVKGMDKLGSVVQRLHQRDALTDTWLRAHFLRSATEALKKPQDKPGRAFLFMVELDHLAEANDTYGVLAIDEALIALVQLLRSAEEDGGGLDCQIGRWSGARFMGWIRADDVAAAKRRFNELQTRFERLDIRFGGTPVALTLSVAFGALPGSRYEDIETGLAGLSQTLDQRSDDQASSVIEALAPKRAKRTFIREDDPSLVRQ